MLLGNESQIDTTFEREWQNNSYELSFEMSQFDNNVMDNNDDYDNNNNDDDDDASNNKMRELETESMSLEDDVQDEQQDYDDDEEEDASVRSKSTPIRYSTRELVAALRTGQDTTGDLTLPDAIQHRIRDFRLAQRKRLEKYGTDRPWGIIGLYDHLASVRVDLEWAEDAAWRRQHFEPYLSWTDFDREHKKVSLRNRPYFTYFIIFFCTVIMIASIGVNGWKFEPISVNPMIGPSADTLLRMGAKQTALIVSGEWFRLFSPIVLHAGLIHYFVNMLALWFIGGAVEKSHGMLNGGILFVLPAIGGNILSAIFLPQYISVGASGGIFGMMGACIADIALNWNMLFIKTNEKTNMKCRYITVLAWLVFDIVLNCLIGLTPFVDNFTHLGGMLYGLLCGLSTMERLADGFFGLRGFAPCSFFARFFGLILSVVGIMISVAVLVGSDGGSSPCHGCRYVSCVPFPLWSEEKWWYCDDCQVVTAQANRNDESNPDLFTSLDLTCPDGVIEYIDISQLQIADSGSIQKQLPSLCRANCESVFNDT